MVQPHSHTMTTLSVVVAFQRSDSMLHRLIAALLDESSRGVEIIVVGEWGAGTREPGVQHVAVPLETPMHVRRNLGLALATGDILCMTDPDVMPRRGWLGAGVSLMAAGWSCAAGPVTSADAAFWGA